MAFFLKKSDSTVETSLAYVCGRAVGHGGVGSPLDGLVRRQAAGPLALEEEQRLRERVGVVRVSGGEDMAGETDEGEGKEHSRA